MKSKIWKSLSFCFDSANVASRYGIQDSTNIKT